MCELINLLITLPGPHLGALARPFTPKMLRPKERTPTPHPLVVFTLDLQLNLLKSLGVRHFNYIPCVICNALLKVCSLDAILEIVLQM